MNFKSISLPEHPHFVIITDANLRELYGNQLLEELKNRGFKTDLLAIEPGEHSKNRETKAWLEDQLLELGANRKTCLIALGGGVVGDLTGFVAATFMRGIPYIQMPTTLLAMVDSSIGGKTGIDTAHGKNLIGAIWQPEQIIFKVEFLETLPDDEFKNGLIEMLKIFLTCDREGVELLWSNLDAFFARDILTLEHFITRAAQLKMGVVQRDEREQNERKILNFGHTVGHAIEHASHYQLKHGFAVALGILVEAKAAELMGILSAEDFQSIETWMKKLKIDLGPLKEFSIDQLWPLMLKDKKNVDESPHFIVLSGIGSIHQNGEQLTHILSWDLLEEAYSNVVKF